VKPPFEQRRRVFVIAVAVFAGWAFFVHFWPHFHTANESIRLYFVQAIVDHGTPYIEPVLKQYRSGNIDAARAKNGRLTLDKAPALSYAVLPLYAAARALGVPIDARRVRWLYYLLLIFGVMLPALFGLYFAARVVFELTGNRDAALNAALLLGLASPYALYSTLFIAHVPAAALLTGSLYYILRKKPLVSGALAGAMVLFETPAFLLASVLGIAAGLKSRRLGDSVRFALAGLPFALAQLAHNAWLFGHPLTFGYARKAHRPFADLMSQGLLGFSLPSAEALHGITLSTSRGLFYAAPVLLLGLVGIALLWRDQRRFEGQLLALALCLHVLLISCFGDWQAGDSFAARHLLLIVPLLAIGVGVLLASASDTAPLRLLRSYVLPALALFSALAAWLPVATFPYAPPVFSAPHAELSLPMLATLQLSPNLGQTMGLGSATSLALFASVLLIAWLASVSGPLAYRQLAMTMVKATVGTLLLLGLLWMARPDPTPETRRARVLVSCLGGYHEQAASICKSARKRFDARRCACRR
jgi:hypothetical protein